HQLFHGGMIEHTLHLVDRELCDEPDTGLTTLVAWAVWKDRLIGVSAGDSALMLVQRGGMRILTERPFKHPPVGSGAVEGVEFGDSLKVPWTLIGMTDGAWKYAGWEKLRAIATEKSGHALIDAALAACRLRSGALADDFTMVVWQAK